MSAKDSTDSNTANSRTSEGGLDYKRFVADVVESNTTDNRLKNRPAVAPPNFDYLFSVTTSQIACFHFPTGIKLDISKKAIVDQIWSKESHCLEVSQTLAKAVGFSNRHKAIGADFSSLFPPNERNFSLLKSWVRQGLASDELFSPYVDDKGKRRIVFTSIYCQRNKNSISHLWIICRDRTRQWEAKKAKELSESHYRSLVERPGVFLIRHELDQKFTYVSEHFSKNFGLSQEELFSSPQLFEHLIHPRDVIKYKRSIERRESGYTGVIERQYRLRHKDSSYHWYYERQTAATDSNEQVSYVDSMLINIQERKHLETSLFHAQRMETLGAMAGGIAHDFNNQLAAILGQLNLSLNELPKDSSLYKRLNAAEQSALACADLAKHLLSFAKHTDSIRESISIADFLTENANLITRLLPSNIELKLELSPKLSYAFCNSTELLQVVTNLCLNARDAMPNGGTIRVSAAPVAINRSSDRLRYPTVVVGNYVEITVKDSGSGIAPEHLSHIFDPYFTTKGASTNSSGLGLSTVYAIIRRHKGEIRVNSSLGEGSEFSFLIPESHVLPEPKSELPTPKISKGHETILVAEDDEMVHEMLCSALESNGYNVIGTKDGEKALKAFNANKNIIGLAIIDHGMPEISGREVVAEISKKAPGLPIILTSGFDRDNIGPLSNGDNSMFVSKPYHINRLLSNVRSLLDAKQD